MHYERMGDVAERIEALSITKRMVSTGAFPFAHAVRPSHAYLEVGRCSQVHVAASRERRRGVLPVRRRLDQVLLSRPRQFLFAPRTRLRRGFARSRSGRSSACVYAPAGGESWVGEWREREEGAAAAAAGEAGRGEEGVCDGVV